MNAICSREDTDGQHRLYQDGRASGGDDLSAHSEGANVDVVELPVWASHANLSETSSGIELWCASLLVYLQ